MKNHVWFRNTCVEYGLLVSDAQVFQLDHYVTLLREWNRRVNLISRKDENNIWENHILHSVSLLFRVSFDVHSRILDLGTGGGLPGIPLKILVPTVEITLLDSITKKANAVKDIVSSLQLRGVDVVCGRAEHFGKRKEFSGRYDFVISRAVAKLKDLVHWAHPFLKHTIESDQRQQERLHLASGRLLAMKGGDVESEIKEVRKNKLIEQIDVVDLVVGSEGFEGKAKKLVVVGFSAGR